VLDRRMDDCEYASASVGLIGGISLHEALHRAIAMIHEDRSAASNQSVKCCFARFRTARERLACWLVKYLDFRWSLFVTSSQSSFDIPFNAHTSFLGGFFGSFCPIFFWLLNHVAPKCFPHSF